MATLGRVFLFLVAVFLPACAENPTGDSAAQRPLGLDYGNAIRKNEALQVIDPRPAATNEPAPALDGRRAAAAIARYQNGVVRMLEIERTADSRTD